MSTPEENKIISYNERRESIAERIKTIGLWNINQSQLAREFGVSKQMISKDLKQITKELSQDEVKEIGVGLLNGLKIAYKMSQKIMINQLVEGEPQVALKACQTIAMLSNSITDLITNAKLLPETTREVGYKIEIVGPSNSDFEPKKEIFEQSKNSEKDNLPEEKAEDDPKDDSDKSAESPKIVSHVATNFNRENDGRPVRWKDISNID